MQNRARLLKLPALLLALASAACFAAPTVIKWTLLHGQSLPEHAANIGVIGGADGPTAIFIATKAGGFSISDSCGITGAVLAAAAAALWLLARVLSRKKQG